MQTRRTSRRSCSNQRYQIHTLASCVKTLAPAANHHFREAYHNLRLWFSVAFSSQHATQPFSCSRHNALNFNHNRAPSIPHLVRFAYTHVLIVRRACRHLGKGNPREERAPSPQTQIIPQQPQKALVHSTSAWCVKAVQLHHPLNL